MLRVRVFGSMGLIKASIGVLLGRHPQGVVIYGWESESKRRDKTKQQLVGK